MRYRPIFKNIYTKLKYVDLNLIIRIAVTTIAVNKDTAPTTAPTTKLLEFAGEVRSKMNVIFLSIKFSYINCTTCTYAYICTA